MEVGEYVALALVLVEVALIFFFVRGTTTKGAFITASFPIVFLAAFFWNGSRVTEITIASVGTIKTAATLATQYIDDIRNIKADVERQKQVIDAVATAAHATDRVITELSDKNDKAADQLRQVTEQLEEAKKLAAEAESNLAKFRAPRTLTKQQQERVVSMLMSFAGTQFDVGSVQGDAESAECMILLETLLQAAGWREVDWVGGDIVMTREGKPTTGLVTTTNVAVAVYPEKTSTLGNAAAALGTALNAEGIAAKAGTTGAGFINKNADAVHILIGRKT